MLTGVNISNDNTRTIQSAVFPSRPRTSQILKLTVAAPLLWNELPDYVTSEQTLTFFKAKLKTHLFSQAYPQRQ